MNNSNLNLLIGALALQLKFIDEPVFVQAVNLWTRTKSDRLDHTLLEMGAIDEETRSLLVGVVKKHLAQSKDTNGSPFETLTNDTVTQVSGLLSPVSDIQVQSVVSELLRTKRLTTLGTQGDDQPTVAFDSSQVHLAAVAERYHILEPHAKGGLGQVFVAEDKELRREVALKEMLPKVVGDESSRARFMLEAEVTGRLEHPGIVPVYGMGIRENGRPFYAMRFIRGETLASAIDRFHATRSVVKAADFQSREFRSLLARLVDVCNAIDYAHSRGVLHRDIKPNNIMLGKFGETLIVDWGLAKATSTNPASQIELSHVSDNQSDWSSGSAPTLHGQAMGTPGFMPPEQAAGRIEELAPTSDVYSIGATLFYLLTGVPPFQSNSIVDVLQRIEQGTFDKPTKLNPAIDRGLESICLQAMSRIPVDRYRTASDLADEMERWMADDPVNAYREGWVTRSRRFLRRHRSWSIASAVALILISLISLVALLIVNGARTTEAGQRRRAQNSEQRALKNEERAVAAERAAEDAADNAKIAYVSTLTSNAYRYSQDGFDELAIVALFEAYKKSVGVEKLESLSKFRLLSMLGRQPLLRTFEDSIIVRLGDDSTQFAAYDDSGHIVLRRMSDGNEIAQMQGSFPECTELCISRNQRRLAAVNTLGEVAVWDAASGRQLLRQKVTDQPLGKLWFDSSGDSLTTLGSERILRNHLIESGSAKEKLSNLEGDYLDSGERYLVLFDHLQQEANILDVWTGRSQLAEFADVTDIGAYDINGKVSPNGERTVIWMTPWRMPNLDAPPAPDSEPAPAPVPTSDLSKHSLSLPGDESNHHRTTMFTSFSEQVWQSGQTQEAFPVPNEIHQTGSPANPSFVYIFQNETGELVSRPVLFSNRLLSVDWSLDSKELLIVEGEPANSAEDMRYYLAARRFIKYDVESAERSVQTDVQFQPDFVFAADLADWCFAGRNFGDSAMGGAFEQGKGWLTVSKPSLEEASAFSSGFDFFSAFLVHDFPIEHAYHSSELGRLLVTSPERMHGARLWNVDPMRHIDQPIRANEQAFDFTSDGQLLCGTSPVLIEPKTRQISPASENDAWNYQTSYHLIPLFETRTRTSERVTPLAEFVQVEMTYTVLRFVVEARESLSIQGEQDDSVPTDFDIAAWQERLNNFAQLDGRAEFLGNSTDLSRVAINSMDERSTIRVWDAINMQPVGNPIEAFIPVRACFFARDNEILVLHMASGEIQLWDVASGTALSPPMFVGSEVYQVKFSQDLRFMAFAGPLGVHLVDLLPDFERSMEELEKKVRDVSLHEVDATGAIVPIRKEAEKLQ